LVSIFSVIDLDIRARFKESILNTLLLIEDHSLRSLCSNAFHVPHPPSLNRPFFAKTPNLQLRSALYHFWLLIKGEDDVTMFWCCFTKKGRKKRCFNNLVWLKILWSNFSSIEKFCEDVEDSLVRLARSQFMLWLSLQMIRKLSQVTSFLSTGTVFYFQCCE
jgi:hypothetical protein